MNKISRNYKPKINLKETQKIYNETEKKLFELLIDKLNLIKVKAPMISKKRQSTETYNNAFARTINYDSINNSGIYHLINKYNYWLINAVKKLEITNNKGIITKTSFINRDEEITNISSMEKNIIQIEYRFDNSKIIFKKLDELINIVYDVLFLIFKEFKFDYEKINYNIPKTLKTFSMNHYNEDKIQKWAIENGLFKLFFSAVQDESNYDISDEKEKIFLFAFLRSAKIPIKLVEASIRQDYLILEKQKKKLSERYVEELNYAKYILEKDIFRTLNISINLDAIVMFLTDKVHILEVQSTLNDENMEALFNQKNIKYL